MAEGDLIPTRSLVTAAQGGDADAFGQLVQRFERPVHAFLGSRTSGGLGPGVGVRDLVQETFVAAHEGLAEFRWKDEAAFQSWIFSIARNVLRMQVRRATAVQRDHRREFHLPERSTDSAAGWDALLDGFASSPSDRLRREERFERLRAALLTLRDTHREVIVLVRLEGLTLAEAGARLGRSDKAVSMLLVRALRSLRDAFGDSESVRLPDRRLDLDPGREPDPG